ncbi:MAG: pitrilysin family protein [Bacteroidota bacterium]
MKSNISIYILACLMSFGAFAQLDRSVMPKPGPAPKISLDKPQEFKLTNGLTVMIVEDNKLPRVSYSLNIDNKPASYGKKAGVESITAGMMGNGTSTIPKEEFNERVDFLGARLNFGSSSAFASGLSKYSEEILNLLADAAINPLLTEEEFEKVKAQSLDGLKGQAKDVSAVASRVSAALSYGKNHPYGEFATEETVNNITFNDVISYNESAYNPDNAYLVVVGDIDYETIKKQIEESFGEWKKSIAVDYSVRKAKPNERYQQINFIDMPNAVQSEITVTNNVDLEMKDPDYHAVLITNKIFGGGFNSYLNMNLREKHGYTYGARSYVGSDEYASRFTAGAAVRNEVTDSAVVQTLEELKRIKTEPVEQDLLKNAKAKYVGDFVLALESPQTIAQYALNIKLNDLPEDFYSTYLEKINAVTTDDVQKMANKYFKTDEARIVVVGKGSEVIENLEKTNIPIRYFDKYANNTEKPKYEVEMPADINVEKVMQAYISAIGGKENLEKVNSVFITAEAEFQPGMMLNLEMKTTDKIQSTTKLTGMGQTIMKSVVDGDSGYMVMQGQKKELSAEELDETKIEAVPFPELDNYGGTASLETIEKVDGKDAYKININEKKTVYYDVESGLKIKQVEKTPMGESVLMYSDYQKVGNIMFPFGMSQAVGPQKFDFKVKEIKVNEGVSDADFD